MAAVEVHADIGHSEDVMTVSWTQDGSRILSGSLDGTVRLWDVATGRLVRVFKNALNSSGVPDRILAAAFVDRNESEIAATTEKSIIVWDAESGSVLRRIGSDRFMTDLCFSPDGHFAAVHTVTVGNNDRRLDLFDIAAGRLVASLPGEISDAKPLALSDNNMLLAVDRGNGLLEVWDTRASRRVARLQGHSSAVLAARFSADGNILLSGSDDKTARIWNVATGVVIRVLDGATAPFSAVALNKEGTTAAVGTSGGTLIQWNVATGQRNVQQRGKAIRAIAFSPDGRLLLEARGHALVIMEAINGRLVRALGVPDGAISALDISPDGMTIAAGDHANEVRLWDVASGRRINTLAGHSGWVRSVAFLPDGKGIVTAGLDGLVRFWDSSTGTVVRDFGTNFGPVESMVASRDGGLIVTGTGDGVVRLWNTTSGQLARQFDGGEGFVRDVSVSADGGRIASLAGNRLRVWDRRSARPDPLLDARVNSLVLDALLSPTADLLTINADSSMMLFRQHGGAPTITLKDGGWAFISSVSFSPDGARLISGSHDGTARIWDLNSGKILKTFNIDAEVSAVTFPRAERAIIGGKDGGVRIFDGTSGELLATLIANRNGGWAVLTPEGFFDGSESGVESLTISHGLDVFSVNQFYQLLYRPDLVREKLSGDRKGRVRAEAGRIGLQVAISSGRPPSIRLGQATTGIDGQATIQAEIADQGGGIGRVEWRINGVTGAVRDADTDGSANRHGVIHREGKFDLAKGRNVIEVVAYNGKDVIASTPASISVDVSESDGVGRLFVLAAGVNDYVDARLRLKNAAPDARAIAEGLGRGKGDLYTSVEETVLLDRDVTADRLDKAFLSLAMHMRPNDTLVLFLAGHGKTVDGHYYFVPSDIQFDGESSIVHRAIGQDLLQRWLAKIPAGRSVLFFDTCDSGSMASESVTQQSLELLTATSMGKMTQATGRTVIAATSENAAALEGYDGHGVLTWSILRAMTNAPTDTDGRIDVAGLIAFVDRSVREVSLLAFHRQQTPQSSLVGADFPLMTRLAASLDSTQITAPDGSRPRYVVLSASRVYPQAGGGGDSFMQLQPGTLVDVESMSQGWALVVREGRRLGYVATDALTAVQ
jgi:WD40 repeat protein